MEEVVSDGKQVEGEDDETSTILAQWIDFQIHSPMYIQTPTEDEEARSCNETLRTNEFFINYIFAY